MSCELDPTTGEVLRSTELRDAVMSLLPPLAIERHKEVMVQLPLSRPGSVDFVEVQYVPNGTVDQRLRLFVVETQPIKIEATEAAIRESTPYNEFRGIQKECRIDPETGEIQRYHEYAGMLDATQRTFLLDDDSRPFLRGQALITPADRLVEAIFGHHPLTEEETALNEAEGKLRAFTKDKLDALFGYFVELGVVDQ